MPIVLEKYEYPEQGHFVIQQPVTIKITATEAKRRVNHWLLHEVSTMLGVEEPELVIGAKSHWRIPVIYTAPHFGEAGQVGTIEVDILTGEMDTTAEKHDELRQAAKELAKTVPPFQPIQVPAEYIMPAPTPTVTQQMGNPMEFLSKMERIQC
ncbi:MAG: hypothetical protein AAF639_41600 [Chloroflexota bacterium]